MEILPLLLRKARLKNIAGRHPVIINVQVVHSSSLGKKISLFFKEKLNLWRVPFYGEAFLFLRKEKEPE